MANYDDNNEYKGQEIEQSKIAQERDVEIFEVSVEETLERQYHNWLGEAQDTDGIYRNDPRLARLMNEKGASFLIGELASRINTNMHFSDLDTSQITWMSSKTAENIMDRLMYYYEEYEMDVKDLEPICDQVLDMLEVLLTNAKEGGMKEYKVARSKVIISKQQMADAGQTAY